MKQKLFFFIAFLFTLSSYAQQQIELRGNVVNSATNQPVAGVLVTLVGHNQTETTNSKGEFQFASVSAGKDVLSLSSAGIIPRSFPVNTEVDAIMLLKDIKVQVVDALQNSVMIGVVNEPILDDDTESSQEISSMVILSNDVYLNKVKYQLSPARFKVRGYDSNYEQKYINGVSFNDQLRGVFNFASIGALNDMTRNGDAVNYQSPNAFTFGSIGGTENINMRAGSYAKGSKVTLSYTNRSYYLRGMATYSTGMQDNGWAFTASVGGRYSHEGNVDGVFYRNFSYAVALEKQINGGEHSISFTTFGSPVKRGQQGASYQEAYDLTGNNLYNPNWGYQEGKKRNARVVTAFDPTAIASHIWKINRNTTLTSGVGVHYGRYGGTALNWANAVSNVGGDNPLSYGGADPRPDYYRSLPSYIEAQELKNGVPEGAEKASDIYKALWRSRDRSTTQINWKSLYAQNQGREDGQAYYMLEERRSDLFETSFNTALNVVMQDNHRVTAGIGLKTSQSKQFKTAYDMLGSTYLEDRDKFAERDSEDQRPINDPTAQNDMNKSGRRIYKGDVFGYDFRLNINNANIWVQDQYTAGALEFYYGAKLSYTDFYRTGKMMNGRYKDNSYGKGSTHTFIDFALKGGLTYKFSGRHFITGNVSYATEAPLPNNAYISPRIADEAADGLESGRVFSADLAYVFSLKSLTGRVSVYQTNFYDQMKRISYYHDSQGTFINHVLTNMNKVNRGVEFGLSYRLNTNWSFDLAGTVAEYYYANNPDGSISTENGKVKNLKETVFLKDYYVGGTPQVAGTFGINYFYDYWFLNLNLNAFGRSYIDIAPLRRLATSYASLSPLIPEEVEAHRILTDQERFGSAYTVDASIGKVLYLRSGHSVNFNFSFNNIFNRQNIRTGGYEQGRIDVKEPRKFGSKYFYMQGFNCFLNASYRF